MRACAILLAGWILMACDNRGASHGQNQQAQLTEPTSTRTIEFDASAALDIVQSAYLRSGLHNRARDLPITTSLREAVDAAEAAARARGEDFWGEHGVLGCNYCTVGWGDVSTAVIEEPGNGRVFVEARFVAGGTEVVRVFEMVSVDDAWRIDNITTPDGYDLRVALRS